MEFKFGDAVQFAAHIVNNGTVANEKGFFLAYYCDDILISTKYYKDPIPPGETIEITNDWQANIVSKSYSLTATVDALEDRIIESDETNNSLTQDITILPDYIVALSTDYPAHVGGDTVRLTAMVANSTAPSSYYTDTDVTVFCELRDEYGVVVVPSTELTFHDGAGINAFVGDIDTSAYANGAYSLVVTAAGIGGAKTTPYEIYVVDDVSITVQTSKPVYYPGEAIAISGQVTSDEGMPMADVGVGISIEVRGFKRQLNVKTDDQGNYQYSFAPLQGEGGSFDVRAVTTASDLYRQAATHFTVEGIFITPTAVNINMSKNTGVKGAVKIINIGTEDVVGLDLSIQDLDEADSVTAFIMDTDLPGILAPGEKLPFTIEVAGGLDAPDQAMFKLVATGDGIPDAHIIVRVTLHDPAPLPVIEPAQFRIGVHPDELVTRMVTIKNGGYGYLHNAKVTSPDLEWISIVGAEIGTLQPSQSQTFEVWIKPHQDTQFGIYQTQIIIECDEGRFYVNATIDVNAAEAGTIQLKVRNDLGDNVPGAMVTLISQDEYAFQTVSGTKSYKHIVSMKTDENGVAAFSDVPIGEYRFQIDANAHDGATGDVHIMPGENNEPVTVNMVTQLVQVEWLVTPIEITDRYAIDLYMTFETEAPKPVLLMTPHWLRLSIRENEEITGTISAVNPSSVEITNLVVDASTLEGVELVFDSPEGETSVRVIDKLLPREQIILSYKARLQENASMMTRNIGSITGRGEYVYFIKDTQEPAKGETFAEIPVKFIDARELLVRPPIIHFTEYCPDFGPAHSTVENPCLWVTNNGGEEVSFEKISLFGDTAHAFSCLFDVSALNVLSRIIGGPIPWINGGFGVLAGMLNSLADEGDSSGGTKLGPLWWGDFDQNSLLPNEEAILDLGALRTHVYRPDFGFKFGFLLFGYKWNSDSYRFSYPVPIFITYVCPFGTLSAIGSIPPIDIGFGGGPGGGPVEAPAFWAPVIGGYTVPGFTKISLPESPPPPSVHEIIKLKISQEAALEREAFNASMEITPLVDDLEGVQVELVIKDDEGNTVNDRFQYTISSMIGINSLDGDSLIHTNNPGKIEWVIVPKDTAGGINPDGINYHVGAKLYFGVNGLSHMYETEYNPIQVKPQPSLTIDYYIPGKVEADVPFEIGVKVRNDGPGLAHNFRIKSAQPEIISNLSGLLVDFVIHGSGVGDIYTKSAMEPMFEKIQPGETVQGYWLMTSTLDGDFTSFQAIMKHENYLGVEINPLIKEINTYIDQWDTDKDNDGLEDAWEIRYWGGITTVGDPNGDYDGDGLSNLDEWTHFADPTKVDTDEDGFSDSEEVEQGTRPWDPDDHPEYECSFNAEDLARALMPSLYQAQVDLVGENDIIEIGYHIRKCTPTSTTIEYNIVFRDEDIGPRIRCGDYDDLYDQCRACEISPIDLLPPPWSEWLKNELYTGRVEDIETIEIAANVVQNVDGAIVADVQHINFPRTWAGDDADNYYVTIPSHATAALSKSEIDRMFLQEQGHLAVYVVTWNHEFYHVETDIGEFVKTADYTFTNFNLATRDDLETKYHSDCFKCFLDQDNDMLTDTVDAAPHDIDGDDDGLTDGPTGSEDLNANGIVDPGETDPTNPDTDGDGLFDGTELGLTEPETIKDGLGGTDLSAGHFIADADASTTTDPTRADTDNDGLLDGEEDTNHNGRVDPGETNPADIDSDADGIQDGTELGLTEPHSLDTDLSVFIPDADPSTTTDPSDSDVDRDGLLDGQEDVNANGLVDTAETDPHNPDTDGDGYNDGEEINAGSNPVGGSSYPTTTTIHLKKGFNLVAIPADLTSQPDFRDWLPMLGDSSEIEKVMVYDGEAGKFITLIPDSVSNPSFILKGGEGLIVYAKQDKEITFTTVLCSTLDLKPGFNLVGFACPEDGYSAYQILNDLGSENISSIQRYSTEKGTFETAGFGPEGQLVGVDFPIVPGEGYFIFMKQEVLDF